jgi:predicted acyl esterase
VLKLFKTSLISWQTSEVLFCHTGILEALQRQLQRLPLMRTPNAHSWAAVRLMGEVYIFKAEECLAVCISFKS